MLDAERPLYFAKNPASDYENEKNCMGENDSQIMQKRT